MTDMRTVLGLLLAVSFTRPALAEPAGASQVRAETGRVFGLKGVDADVADFRAERAALDNIGQPICVLRMRRRQTIMAISGTSDDCTKQELVDVTAVDPHGRPVPGLQLESLDLRTDANGKLRVPKKTSEIICGGRLSGQGWSEVVIPPHTVHAHMTMRPVAALRVEAHLGLVPCLKPTLSVDPSPGDLQNHVWSPDPGVLLASDLSPGKAKVTVSCGLAGTTPQTVDVKLEQMTDAKVSLDFPDPTLTRPEDHFSVRGVVATKGALDDVRVRVHCDDVVRIVTVNKDGSFEAAHLPESPRCGLVYGTRETVAKAVVPSPSDKLQLQLP